MPEKAAPKAGGKVVSLSEARANKKPAEHLPKVSPIVVDAIKEMLQTNEGMCRPPEKAAAILALIAELHKGRQPFPSRAAVAKALDCSVFTVDAVLSTRIDEGYIDLVVETETGNVSKRHSTVRRRYYVPSAELKDVADRASRRRA